jgi:ribulose-phosphate 3-epimerase
MSAKQVLEDLQAVVPAIAPSLLSCDFANMGREIGKLERAGARLLHLDIMDGHFVPNLSIGVPVVEAVRRSTELPLDVHLMLSDPGPFLPVFRRAGADMLTIHIEAAADPQPLLDEIHDLGALAGLSLKPPTPVASLEKWLPSCDLVLVMSVMPGFGGQHFEPVALEKIRQLRELAGQNLLISVDGGVNRDTLPSCSEAGTDLFVTGSDLFAHRDYGAYMEEMTTLARENRHAQV